MMRLRPLPLNRLDSFLRKNIDTTRLIWLSMVQSLFRIDDTRVPKPLRLISHSIFWLTQYIGLKVLPLDSRYSVMCMNFQYTQDCLHLNSATRSYLSFLVSVLMFHVTALWCMSLIE